MRSGQVIGFAALAIIAVLVLAFSFDPPAEIVATHEGLVVRTVEDVSRFRTGWKQVSVQIDGGPTVLASASAGCPLQSGNHVIIDEFSSFIFGVTSYVVRCRWGE